MNDLLLDRSGRMDKNTSSSAFGGGQMIRTVGLVVIFGLLSGPTVWAKKATSMTKEQVVADFVRRHLLTTEQGAALKSSDFLGSTCTSDRPSSCRPTVNLSADCNV